MSVPIKDLASKAHAQNVQLHGDGYYAMEYPDLLPEDGYAYAVGPLCFGTQVALVLVDVETGQVQVENLVAVHDVGRVINPHGVHGQIEGGVSQGFGYALLEELQVESGLTRNRSLETYLIPTASDVPPIQTRALEIPEPFAPLGARGIGEPPLNPTAPAIANAVSDALGIPMDDLPLTPEKVLAAIEGQTRVSASVDGG